MDNICVSFSLFREICELSEYYHIERCLAAFVVLFWVLNVQCGESMKDVYRFLEIFFLGRYSKN